jgi:hypothetical protein
MPHKIKELLSKLEHELKLTDKLEHDEREHLGNSVSFIREKLEMDNEAILKNMGDDLEKIAIKYEESLPKFSSLISKLTQSLTALGI